ncbi:aldose 1-epimerase family protein [Arthrobacter sp. 35W]|uniref:aldose 1-epimerase family protein n=1 Tax=Arthrobacter sp. 35W TaxID=1132441 RepID=UPI000403C204|nr:aldose 1-epimerase family protein [Arthrobacter sp. 35W]
MNPATSTAALPCATGAQFTLTRGGAVAQVVALAAGLRLFARDGVALTESYADHQIAPGAAGITLAPFANRVDGGRWLLDGAVQQLDITEVDRNNAIHGLLRNTAYTALESSAHHVLLEAAIHPQHGFPFLLRHQVRYTLGEDENLLVEQTLLNDGAARAPYVLGAHPYLCLGSVPTEELTITVPAATVVLANERLIPTGTAAVGGATDAASAAAGVPGGGVDLRAGRLVGGLSLDSAFTGLDFAGGRATTTLTAPDGRTVWLWQEEGAAYVHIFATDKFPGRTKAVAVEPMTGPANAFNSGDGLNWLEPGSSATLRWGIGASL